MIILQKIFSIIFVFIVKSNIKKEKSEELLNTTTTKYSHIVKKHEYEKNDTFSFYCEFIGSII